MLLQDMAGIEKRVVGRSFLLCYGGGSLASVALGSRRQRPPLAFLPTTSSFNNLLFKNGRYHSRSWLKNCCIFCCQLLQLHFELLHPSRKSSMHSNAKLPSGCQPLRTTPPPSTLSCFNVLNKPGGQNCNISKCVLESFDCGKLDPLKGAQ